MYYHKDIQAGNDTGKKMLALLDAIQKLETTICKPDVSPLEYQTALKVKNQARNDYARTYLSHRKPLAHGIIRFIQSKNSKKFRCAVHVEIPFATQSITMELLETGLYETEEEAIKNICKAANIEYSKDLPKYEYIED